MSDMLGALFSAVAGPFIKGGWGIGMSLIHIRNTYNNEHLEWYDKIIAMIGPTLHATASILAGAFLLTAAITAGATFLLPPIFIVVSATAFIDNVTELFKDIRQFFNLKNKIKNFASTIDMPDNALNSKSGSFLGKLFDYTEVTPEIKDYIKKKFEHDNEEDIARLNVLLPTFLEKKKEVHALKNDIKALKKQHSELNPGFLNMAIDRIKIYFGAEKPIYLTVENPRAQSAAILATLSHKNDLLDEKKNFFKDNEELRELRVQIFEIQKRLDEKYQSYQSLIDAINKRNTLLMKIPMRIINTICAAAVCGLSISLIAAPLTHGASIALTVACAVATAVGGVAISVMIAKEYRNEKAQKKEVENLYLDILDIDQRYKKQYRNEGIFKKKVLYGQKDDVFKAHLAQKQLPEPERHVEISTFGRLLGWSHWGKGVRSEKVMPAKQAKMSADTTLKSPGSKR